MPLTTWNAESSALVSDWKGIAYSPTKAIYVAVAFNGAKVMSSPDGITWTQRTAGSAENWGAVVWHDSAGLFIAVGSPAVVSNWMTSPDGVTWTTHTPENVAGNAGRELAYNPTAGVALTMGGVSSISYTANGTTWTSFTLSNPTAQSLSNVVWDAAHSKWVMTDQSATVWTSAHPPSAGSWTKITANAIAPDGNGTGTGALCVGGGTLVMVGQATIGGARCQTSTDGGATWTLRTSLDPTVTWESCAYDTDDSLFVAVGLGGHIATSPDGITWTNQTSPAVVDYTAVTYANKLAVAVARSGTTVQQVAISTGGSAGSIGAASGQATAAGVGKALHSVVGTATGHATVAGSSTNMKSGVGSSVGSAVVHGVGRALVAAKGTAAGIATVLGVSASIVRAVGTAVGFATVQGSSTNERFGVGAATGSATVQGVGVTALFVQAIGRVGVLGMKSVANFTAWLFGHGVLLAAGDFRRVPSVKGIPIVSLKGQQSGIGLTGASVSLKGDTQD